MTDQDCRWMSAAIRQAIKAKNLGEPPVGAVLVHEGRIIGRGCNRREICQDVTRHAEIEAIRQACRRLRSWRLEDCVLYVTLEPCIMCAGAIVQSRIGKVVFGAWDPKAGAAGSLTNVFALRQNHRVDVHGGVMAEICSELLKSFFHERRRLDKAMGSRSQRKRNAVSCPAAQAPAPDESARPDGG